MEVLPQRGPAGYDQDKAACRKSKISKERLPVRAVWVVVWYIIRTAIPSAHRFDIPKSALIVFNA